MAASLFNKLTYLLTYLLTQNFAMEGVTIQPKIRIATNKAHDAQHTHCNVMCCFVNISTEVAKHRLGSLKNIYATISDVEKLNKISVGWLN